MIVPTEARTRIAATKTRSMKARCRSSILLMNRAATTEKAAQISTAAEPPRKVSATTTPRATESAARRAFIRLFRGFGPVRSIQQKGGAPQPPAAESCAARDGGGCARCPDSDLKRVPRRLRHARGEVRGE